MKKYLLLLSSAVILFTSCDKDDPKPDPILGKWEFKYLKLEVQNNPQAADSLDGNYTAALLYEGYVSRITLEIKNDKTFEETLIYYNATTDSEDGEWEKTNDSFTLSYDTEDSKYTIQKVDEDDLELLSQDFTTITFKDDQNQVIGTVDVKATSYYEK
jgi:hypothetical protein